MPARWRATPRSISPAARSCFRLWMTPALFVRSDKVPLTVVGGTGLYQNARGNGTVQIPAEVPNQTDANFVLNLTGV